MTTLKISLVLCAVLGLCGFVGFWTAAWAGFAGLYRCEDVQCPFIVTFVAGPLCGIGYFAVVCAIYLLFRRSKREIL